jgi:threonine/homoserine/homoserine lactone efflux protein
LFVSFVIFGVIAALTPGPNNVMLTTTGLNFGVRRGIPHLLGICIGFPVMLALIGLGFGTLFQLFPVLHEIIKVVGIVYLVYLAWKIATAEGGAAEDNTSLDDNFFLQVVIICTSFAVITFPCAGAWLVFGAGLQHFLKDPLHRKTFNVVMALLLIASILPVVWDMFQ